jgi:hypothetical protein
MTAQHLEFELRRMDLIAVTVGVAFGTTLGCIQAYRERHQNDSVGARLGTVSLYVFMGSALGGVLGLLGALTWPLSSVPMLGVVVGVGLP